MSSKINTIVSAVQNGSTTAREQIQTALQKAKDNTRYHALLSLTEDRALQRADEIDARVKSGEDVGKLAGVPFVVKDNYLALEPPRLLLLKYLKISTHRFKRLLSKNSKHKAQFVSGSQISMHLHTVGRQRIQSMELLITPMTKPKLPVDHLAARP